MAYEPPLPNSSRLIDWGHSWVAPPPNAYGQSSIAAPTPTNTEGNYPWGGEQWPFALRDALGIGSQGFTKTYQVPSSATAALYNSAGTIAALQAAFLTTDYTTFLDYVPEDCTIDAVYFVPNGALTGGTNTRTVALQNGNWFATNTLASLSFTTGVNMVQGTPVKLFSMNDGTGLSSSSGVNTPYFPALRGVTGSTALVPQELYWKSTHVSSGVADPGGTVIIRYGTRYRNYGVVGAQLLTGQTEIGSWVTCLSWSPFSHPNGIEVNFTASGSVGSAVTVNCSPLRYPIASGEIVYFNNAGMVGTMTLTAAANFGATSVTGNIATANILAHSQGHARGLIGSNATAGETLSPTGINVWTHGVNDADNATQDVNAWTETVRSVISKNLCPAWLYPLEGNWVTSTGTGTWTGITSTTYVSSNQPWVCDPYNVSGTNGGMQIWTGTSPTSSDKITVSIGPAFEGGTVDLIVLGIAGTGAGSDVGVAGSVTVDGATPSQGSVTINTSGVSTSGLLARSQTGCSTATSTTLTFPTNTITVADVGSVVTGTNVPPGTFIVSILSGTTCQLSNATTGTTGSLTMKIRQYVPMVKRITGLAAGAHTVTLTITGSDSANSALFVYGLGLESQNPTTPVLWCNIARCPSQSAGQLTNIAALNTASLAVINGTATPLAGNTAEPAFAANVQYVDIDTLFGNSSVYFIDGTHLNAKGHRLLARTLFSVLRNNYSPDQLIAR